MKRLAYLVLALLVPGCVRTARPVVIPPAPAPLAFDLVACRDAVVGNYCNGPSHAQFRLTPMSVTASPRIQGGDDNGYVYVPAIPSTWTQVALTITAPGFEDFETTVTTADLIAMNAKIAANGDHFHNFFQLHASRMYPPEAGPLRVSGTHFYDQNGQVWQGRSLTQFLLCARLWAGESITPQLTWAAQHGFNVVRVFGPVPWPDSFAQGLEMVPSAEQLDACFGAVEAAGLRIEYTPITYAYPIDQQRALVRTVFDVAARHWGTFVEIANEPEPNGVDPVAIMQGVDRHGVIAALGLDPERVPGPNYFHVPVLDYATSHDLARDEAHSPRNSKDTRDAEDVLHVPVWDDEPIGVIDPAKFNFHQTGGSLWERPGGGSVRTTNCDITTAHAAIALALTGLTTYHSQAGLEGRVPGSDEPLQAQCGSQIGALGKVLDASAQLGAYSRPGINWPLTWTAGDGDSLVAHAYASINGGTAYVVVPMPAPGWSLQPVDGWTVDLIGAQPWIARLRR
jgi:hypothetical protein